MYKLIQDLVKGSWAPEQVYRILGGKSGSVGCQTRWPLGQIRWQWVNSPVLMRCLLNGASPLPTLTALSMQDFVSYRC